MITYGRCGDNLYWGLSEDGTLTIMGTGDMYEYPNSFHTPWSKYKSRLKRLVIVEGVTSISQYAFEGCGWFRGRLVIPNTVKKIGNFAFRLCDGFDGNLVIPESVETIGDKAFAYCDGFSGDLIIPESVKSIGNRAFWCCFGFQNVKCHDGVKLAPYAFTFGRKRLKEE